MKQLIYLIFILFICYACNFPGTQGSAGESEIQLKFECDTIRFSDMIDTIMYIPLQTNDKSIIGKISRIFFQQNKYYIFDAQQKKVVVFDETGKYISQLNKNGKGPCEYVDVRDIFVNRRGIVKILSSSNPIQFIEYDLKSDSCKSVSYGELTGYRFYPYDAGYLFFSPIGDGRPNYRFFLFAADSTGKVLNKWLPSHPPVEYSLPVKAFGSYKDTVLFNKHFDNHIYQISPDKEISVRYTLNYGKYQIPEKVKAMFRKSFQYYLENSDGYILVLDFFYETPDLLVFSYLTHQGDSPFFALFVKDKKELIVLRPKDDIAIAVSDPVNLLDDGFFISFLDVSDFLDASDEGWKNRLYKIYPGLESAVENLSEISNPVLIKYKFKKQ
ncbi:MAG: 6-bladed beta-propeller [Tannerella sp.]|jgi:hypothetical protein|nr:6-bladed beta-propeller [Tannerella sp.]